MDILAQIDQDIKAAMLGGDKQKVEVLRGLKSSFGYAKTAPGNNNADLSQDALLAVIAKESKKRQDSADLYTQGNAPDRAKAELEEKVIIDQYLPAQMSDEDLDKAVDNVIKEFTDQSGAAPTSANLGALIGLTRTVVGNQADGGRIAKAVKEKLGI